MTDFGRRVPLHAPAHQDGGGDEISVAALSGLLADAQVGGPHALAGAAHIADVLADLNALISDATLDKDTDTRTPAAHKASHQDTGTDEISVAALSGELADDQPPKAHLLGSASHSADTLANLNAKVSDGDLDKTTDTRTPAAHKASHQDGGTDEIAATGLVGRINLVDRGNATAYDFAVGNFTTNANWHDINFDAIAPAGTLAVLCRVQLQDNQVASLIQFKKKGQANDHNAAQLRTYVADVLQEYHVMIYVDADRKSEYYADNRTFTTINLVVRGWFI